MFRKDGNLPWKINVVAGDAEVCGAAPCLPIGQIQTASGFVTVTRVGGTIVAVKPGDVVYQGEVIETAADGAVGIIFADGTTFNLSASARMVLDEFVCGPKGAVNAALFSLTRGTFAFVLGKLAKTGSLRIETPLASIQGRAQGCGFGILTLAALTFSVMPESHAEGPGADADWLEDDAIELDHSAFTVTTHEATPRTLVVKDLDRALVISLKGSTISVDYVSLSPAQVAANARFSNDVATQQQAGFSLRPTDVTGTGGSSYGTFAFNLFFAPPTTLQTTSLTTTTSVAQSNGSSTSGGPTTLPHTVSKITVSGSQNVWDTDGSFKPNTIGDSHLPGGPSQTGGTVTISYLDTNTPDVLKWSYSVPNVIAFQGKTINVEQLGELGIAFDKRRCLCLTARR